MSLKLLLGASGYGKTYSLYDRLVKDADANPDKKYILIVPEQSSLQAQKNIVRMSGKQGVFNIDVLTFGRLGHRIFEELGVKLNETIDDTGKNLIVRKVINDVGNSLKIIKPGRRQGFISELKSMISELKQYGISPDGLMQIINETDNARLKQKLTDIHAVYERFEEYTKDKYVTVEDKPEILLRVIDSSSWIKDTVIAFDGFTGFTPVQYKLIEKLLVMACEVIITVTLPDSVDYNVLSAEGELFSMSKTMISKAGRVADKLGIITEVERIMPDTDNYRFSHSKELDFLEKNLFAYNGAKYNGEVNDIVIGQFSNPQNELRYTAAAILRQVRENNLRYREIAVVTGDMDTYGREAMRIFKEAGIPFFMDAKRSIIGNPLVEYIRGIIEILVMNYSYESVFRVLKNGLCSIEQDRVDKLENYVLGLGIRGRKRYHERFIRENRGKNKEIDEINATREEFVKKISAFEEEMLNSDKTAASYVQAIYNFMEQENTYEVMEKLADSIDEPGKAEEYRRTYSQIIGLLDRIYAMFGDEKLSLEEFSEILDAGFEEIKVGIIPPTVDCVTIGDMERTRLENIKVLFVLGVNEGLIPKTASTHGVLSDYERKLLSDANVELSPTPREKVFMQNFYIYLNFTEPEEKLYLLYHNVDSDGNKSEESRLIPMIKKMYPKLSEINDLGLTTSDYITNGNNSLHIVADSSQLSLTDESFFALYDYMSENEPYKSRMERYFNTIAKEEFKDTLSRHAAQMLYKDMNKSSITRVENYASCAFSHFAGYGLELEERAMYEIDALDMGNVFHRSIELMSLKLESEGKSFADVDKETLGMLADNCVTEATVDFKDSYFADSATNAYLRKRITDIVKNTAWVLGRQLAAGELRPWRCEEKISKEYDNMILSGKIDRIDTAETDKDVYVKVIDYKSSPKSITYEDIYNGRNLQLLVYLRAALDMVSEENAGKNVIAAGVLYNYMAYPFVNRVDGVTDYGRKIVEVMKPTGLVGYESIKMMSEHSQNVSEILPVKANKEGFIPIGKNVITDRQLKLLVDFAIDKMAALVNEINDGHIEVNPYKDSCKYCPYHGVCGFDGKEYRRMENPDSDTMWKLFGWEDNENGVD